MTADEPAWLIPCHVKGTLRFDTDLLYHANFLEVFDDAGMNLFPLESIKGCSFRQIPDDRVSYTYIYEPYKEKVLPEGEFDFGASFLLGTNRINISLPRSTKKSKKLGDFFR